MLAPQEFTDVTYVVEEDAFAIITINRPERFNAFRGRTIDELNAALKHAWADSRVAAVILTGAGDKAFCAGGDVKERAETGSYGETESGLFEIQALHQLIRAIPKPVIAAVNGAAVGGGHVLHVLCDLSIASSTARFGQTGPRVGSFDAGFGTAYLARRVGKVSIVDVNEVVPPEQLMDAARGYARTVAAYSPTAIRFLKHSFNADTDHQGGIGNVAFAGLDLFVHSDEGREGAQAFADKRPPDFSPYR